MKFITVLAFAASFNAFADGTQVIRVFDGATARCETKQDAYRYREGVYTVSEAKVAVKNDVANVKVVVSSYKCARTSTGYRFVPEVMYETKEFATVDGGTVTVETLDARLKAMVDGVYDVIADEALTDTATQTVRMQIPLSELPVVRGQRQIDLFLMKLQRYTVEASNYQENSRRSFGAFRIRF